ncbi:Swi3-domain-containing protein [Dendrothele bispora CBS 962.96]|uniref:Chromosome segregation in meiosis protein n=1 Tax=Dendrothele bispora (strain CBS 962.96) TaxID=1314807 RepID=A0A4S8LK03_DENBC|nr:Swi3-domain-containing protein [Dendrothele bispora CBS 962.96]
MAAADPLFLPDVDDESNINPPVEDIDIEEIFKGIDDDDDLFNSAPRTERFDVAAELRKADAKYKKTATRIEQRQILPSSSPPRDFGAEPTDGQAKKTANGAGKGSKNAETKEKRKPMRLDEARLVGPTGFSQLIESTKNFRIKGKGHEASDLNRLLQIYQYWTHSMYPKSQFRDTVERVEKLCHSKRMHNKLSMWRDEAHGIKPQSDSEEEDDNAVIDLTNSTQKDKDHPDGLPSDAAEYASSSPIPTRPPSSPDTSGRSDADDEVLDAAMRDLDEAFNATRAATQTTSESSTITTTNAKKNTAMDVDDDEEMWAALGEMDGNAVQVQAGKGDSSTREDWEDMDDEDLMSAFHDAHRDAGSNSFSTKPVSNDTLDDEDMWDMVREAEKAGAMGSKTGLVPDADEEAATIPKRPLSIEEDPDMADFYEDP